ncbi:MAG: type II secretion system protein N [Thermodesulfobacteriota bacterium]|nr:type II secretion system protein N [Thermodesulfobacteriota bacterium]
MELEGLILYKRLKYIFFLLLVTIVVYFINTLFIFYLELRFTDYLPPSMDEMDISHPQQREYRPYQYYQRIWGRNLFSVKTHEAEKRDTVDLRAHIDNLSLTSMNFTLIGTIINEGGNSLAIIRDNQTNREDKYKTGSFISGAKVVMILRNKVVLNIDGKDELLVMGIEKIRAEKDENKKITKGSGKAEVISYTISKAFVQQSINNVAQIMSLVRVKPYFKDDKPAGFKISRIKDGSIFKAMGFKDGDIIKSVNGENIYSAEDIMRLYNTLKDSTFFSMGIVRENQVKTLNFKVK